MGDTITRCRVRTNVIIGKNYSQMLRYPCIFGMKVGIYIYLGTNQEPCFGSQNYRFRGSMFFNTHTLLKHKLSNNINQQIIARVFDEAPLHQSIFLLSLSAMIDSIKYQLVPEHKSITSPVMVKSLSSASS